MNRKVFLHMMLPPIITGLLIAVGAGRAHSQTCVLVVEGTKVGFHVSIDGLERQQFLADPVSALRSQGIQVPQSAEAPWREFTKALRRLNTSQSARITVGRNQSSGNEKLHFTIEIREGRVIYHTNGEANSANPRANSTGLARKFLEDPVGTLRERGISIASTDESTWQQLAGALKAVQLAHAQSRLAVDRKGTANSDSPLRPTKGTSTAQNGSLADGRYQVTALASQVRASSDEAFRSVEKQRRLVMQQAGRLTSREVAREKAVLQQLEANAKGAAEVLESVKRFLVQLDRQPARSDGISRLIAVAQLKAQTASNEALEGAEKQRKLVKQQELLRSPARELAREKAVLQQLEANAKSAADVLDSIKRLAAEVDRKPAS